jgi:hypothetical protein
MKTKVGRMLGVVWLCVACLGLLLSPLSAQEPKLRDTLKGHTARTPTTRGPRRGGLRGDAWAEPAHYPCAAKPNLPGSVFVKRDCVPLVRVSVRMALYRVAAGVLPPGLVQ